MTTVTIRDWFTHTATVPAEARCQVNQQLAAYSDTVQACATRYLGKQVTVCVSGSLARGEPAVRREHNRYRLASDVDLVAIIDTTETAAQAENFRNSVLRHHPQIETTVFATGRRDLARVAGRFGADLYSAATRPLAGPVPDPAVMPRLGKREGLEGITHQLATRYDPDNSGGDNPWRVKTVLEALRAVADHRPGPHRFSDLPSDPAVRERLDPAIVAQLVRARENSTALPITIAEAYRCVIASACWLFGVPATHRDLIDALHTIEQGTHLLDGFQAAVLAATIVLDGPITYRRSAASALHVIATAIDPSALITAHDSLRALTAISPIDICRGLEHPNHVLCQHIQGLRRDYYAWLGPHNFGTHPVAEYRGPALANLAPSTRSADHG
ncbi:hypothetical protein IRT45_18430 [Nocardia sp. BSTN01]|uniref:hypothetical protein n=1 Tax=Nocardia sp. BSTN01 TaxID=2783665 RepID=UPI00188E6838|nr:hypothetical protein [Nocardia sp. BSTN01]MBF4999128.1 hypothetical protein [Nocardia sp. BSTN01]